MFSGTVNWALMREHYPQFMQLALAIQSGALAPSAVLARINSYSTRNRIALALQDLGKAVRTTYLLEWIMNDSLRRTVHKGTTKIERHHKFAKHLAFGGEGLFRTGRADLAFLSRYATSKLKRFGDYPTNLKPEAMPTATTLRI